MRARQMALGAAFPIALAIGASCVLPAYEVGEASTGVAAGGSTGESSAVGGGGREASSSTASHSSAGVGGGEIGGAGIGGHTSCTETNGGTIVAKADRPHGIAVSANWVFWIADPGNQVSFAPQKKNDRGPINGATGICGMSASGEDNAEVVATRNSDGVIAIAHPPDFSDYAPIYTPTTLPSSPYAEGSCAISLSADGASLYGFELVGGSYQLTLYPFDQNPPVGYPPTTSRPIAINAINENDVAWIEGGPGTTMFHFMNKKTKKVVDGALVPATDVCAFGPKGKFGFTEPSFGIFYSSPGDANVNGYQPGVAADRIACRDDRRVWIVPGPGGCNNLQSNHSLKDVNPTTFAPNQPRACSLAISQDSHEVYWTNCEPGGGVYRASAP